MKVVYTKRSRKDFKNLPRKDQKRIAEKMRFYISQENPLKYAKKLTDKKIGEYRFRVGNYRIFFDLVDGNIWVVRVKHRRNSY